jgi:uncharacterized protein
MTYVKPIHSKNSLFVFARRKIHVSLHFNPVMTQIWAVTDYRIGTANQVLGVARHLRVDVIEKKLAYTRLSKLPNILTFGNGLRGIDSASREEFHAPYPEMVITAGRRAAPVAAHIKARSPHTKLIHIMQPHMSLQPFDLVVIPSHDTHAPHPRIMTTLGAPHALTDELLFAARARSPLNPELLPRPWTLLCLGGNTKHGMFSLADSAALVAALAPLGREGTILVTSSRRTPPAVAQVTMESIRHTYPALHLEYYSPQQSEENPYHAWLVQSDRIVITADSVSMICEAAFTAKATYIFTPKEAASPKHQRFVSDMVDADYVKRIESYNPLWHGGVRLDEARRVANRIKESVLRV